MSEYIGKRIRLVHVDDAYTRVKSGDEGTVVGHRESILGDEFLSVQWDSGSTLSLIIGIDSFRILEDSAT